MMDYFPGIYDLTMADYRQAPGLNSSGLKDLSRAPAIYQYNRQNPRPSTDAMRIGTATHTMTFEPEKFDAEMAIAPDRARRSKADKEWWADFEARNQNKTVIKQADSDVIRSMADAVRANPAAAELLAQGVAEMSAFWTQPDYAFLCKARPDWLPGGGIIVDLKTCRDASQRAFSFDAGKFKYYWQAAFYLDGLTEATGVLHDTFYWICVENTPPYLTAVYKADAAKLDKARYSMRPLFAAYSECLLTDTWPGYGDVQLLDTPDYFL